MQIVIDIPEGAYEEICRARFPIQDGYRLVSWIKDGTSLPKGHGDLIDKRKFKKWIEVQDGDKLMTEYYLDALDMQETIVEGSHDGDID